MGYDIFVSYSSHDKHFADALVNALENNRMRCWYAPRDIGPGETWPTSIAAALKRVPVMILVFSAFSNASQEVSRELTLASNNQCVVIPVRIENVVPSEELEYHLTNRHWLDVYDMEFGSAINRILEVVSRYENLFWRDEDGKPDESFQRQAPGGAYAGTRFAHKRKVSGFRFLPALAVLLLAGVFWFFNSRTEPEHVIPMPDVPLYSYAGAGGVAVSTLRLDVYNPEQYLVRISGTEDAGTNGMHRCERVDTGNPNEYRFSITLENGRKPTLFMVSMGNGAVYQLESPKAYSVFFTNSTKDVDTIQEFVEAYDFTKK